jgi:hypothetical protein
VKEDGETEETVWDGFSSFSRYSDTYFSTTRIPLSLHYSADG